MVIWWIVGVFDNDLWNISNFVDSNDVGVDLGLKMSSGRMILN